MALQVSEERETVGSDRTVSDQPTWRRSSRCVTEHHCVEFTLMGDGVALRNSQRPMDMLLIRRSRWSALVAAIRAGAFDAPAADA
ncbi:DUF397 domain-containing protein [Plantactinospora sp. BC1]|uniref:DUF397 domain-containing protein n=1 Tax=Plantactinospora sp. BC1 TaxID=2108470 RepID=UPI000D160C92|nr:DUF397 domain-containing protein [Plantactinospora sp. BC1]